MFYLLRFFVCFIPYSYFAIVHDSRGCVGTTGRVRARSPTRRRAAIRRAILLYPFRTLEIRNSVFKFGYRMYLPSRVCPPRFEDETNRPRFVLILFLRNEHSTIHCASSETNHCSYETIAVVGGSRFQFPSNPQLDPCDDSTGSLPQLTRGSRVCGTLG